MNRLKPIIVLASLLFVIILAVPSLLVIPFADKATGELAEEQQKLEQTEPNIISESAVEVAVYRSITQAIENVPLEEYVIGVLASEMPAEFELEALKAQALAARTYIVRQLLSEESISSPEGAAVTDTVMHQVYKNDAELKKIWGKEYDWKMKKITEAVAATQGQIITFEGAPITPSFFSTSNGFTENAEDYWQNPLPYLKSVPSPWDESSEKFHHQKTISVVDFEKNLGVKLESNSSDIGKITERTTSQRVATVEIAGKTFTGRDVREKLGLQSTDFTWKRNGDSIVITTKGFGHGVGLSQYGANGMAEEGKSYSDIVKYYYQGVEISSADNFVEKITAKR